ncbi:MAG: hypothetical protein Q8R39_02545 [bacterium]|nr:hypothetical protein [bacterium]MDZ4284508.1 hypothetical protein [Patescibacteria group bacterium]
MSIGDLMECFANRPQTWAERRKQLEEEGRTGRASKGAYPKLLTLFEVGTEKEFWRAQEMTNAPVALSEERYPDAPNDALMYITGDLPPDSGLHEFWQVYWHLTKAVHHHECNWVCQKYELSEPGRQGAGY